MAFSSTRFLKQNFNHRTETVEVPALKDWFGKDEDPKWEVRGLSGAEISRSQEAVAKNKNMSSLIEAFVSSGDKDKVDALRTIIGTSDDNPSDLVKRIEMLVFGSVKPKIDMTIAVKLAENFPVEFMNLTNKITILTGLGSEMVKSKPSGKIQK